MNKKTERIATAIAIAIVAGIHIAMGAVMYMSSNGDMEPDAVTATLSFLAITMMTVVVLFGAFMMNSHTTEERYARFLEEKEKKE